MESVQEVNQSIVKLCMIIQQHYPELEKYLDEMPTTIPIQKNTHVHFADLIDYRKSLEVLLEKSTRGTSVRFFNPDAEARSHRKG